MSYEELDHTADIRLRVISPSLDSLFAETALAMMKIIYGEPCPGEVGRTLELEAGNTENLLLDFLSEVLFLSEVEYLVFSSAIVHLAGNSLKALLTGEPFDPERHRGGTEIKGISYSGLRIVKEDEGYVLDILFDV
ncbi:MAG: archease [Methanomicrobiales archaeon]|nr:archease [Methanomicrobiales archaeon]